VRHPDVPFEREVLHVEDAALAIELEEVVE
jgi:hypothetical protein